MKYISFTIKHITDLKKKKSTKNVLIYIAQIISCYIVNDMIYTCV